MGAGGAEAAVRPSVGHTQSHTPSPGTANKLKAKNTAQGNALADALSAKEPTFQSQIFSDFELLQPSRKRLAHLLESTAFEGFIGVLIFFNIVLQVLETNERAKGHEVSWELWTLDKIMIFIFMVEVCCRLYAFHLNFFNCWFNIFDMFVISVDITVEFAARVSRQDLPSVTLLRVLRVVRTVRMVRVVRSSEMLRELYLMLHSLTSAFRAILWATLLLTVMLTVWSIVAVEILQPINLRVAADGTYLGCDRCPRAFESVEASVLTFFQQIVAGDSWGLVSLPVMEKEPWTVMLFMAVLVSIELGLLNLILAAIVDRAASARADDDKYQLRERGRDFDLAKKKLVSLCAQLDDDDSGFLTNEELAKGFDSNREFAMAMAAMDVQREDLACLFSILDEDGSGAVDYKEFIEQLHKMKSQDNHMMLVFIKSHVKTIGLQVQEQLTILSDFLHQHAFEMRSLNEASRKDLMIDTDSTWPPTSPAGLPPAEGGLELHQVFNCSDVDEMLALARAESLGALDENMRIPIRFSEGKLAAPPESDCTRSHAKAQPCASLSAASDRISELGLGTEVCERSTIDDPVLMEKEADSPAGGPDLCFCQPACRTPASKSPGQRVEAESIDTKRSAP